MIVYGTRGLKSKGEPGTFYCPVCQSTGGYQHIRVRRWFTLYFIPLIPLGMAGEYLECSGCRGTFEMVAASMDADAYAAESRQFEAEFQKAMKGTMLLTLLADGRVEPAELQAVCEIYARLTGIEYPAQVAADDCRRFAESRNRVEDYLADIGARLNDGGKGMVYHSAWLIANADGELAAEEKAILKRIRSTLGLTRAEVRRIESTNA